MKNVSWLAVLAVAAYVAALSTAVSGAVTENWYGVALGGVEALVGIGLTLLSWREDR